MGYSAATLWWFISCEGCVANTHEIRLESDGYLWGILPATCISMTWQIHFQVGECLWFTSDSYWFSLNNSPPTCRGEIPRPFAKASGCWNLRMIIPQMIYWVWYFSKNFPNPKNMPKKPWWKNMTHLWKKGCLQHFSCKNYRVHFVIRIWPWVNLQHCLGPFSRKPWPSWKSSGMEFAVVLLWNA